MTEGPCRGWGLQNRLLPALALTSPFQAEKAQRDIKQAGWYISLVPLTWKMSLWGLGAQGSFWDTAVDLESEDSSC